MFALPREAAPLLGRVRVVHSTCALLAKRRTFGQRARRPIFCHSVRPAYVCVLGPQPMSAQIEPVITRLLVVASFIARRPLTVHNTFPLSRRSWGLCGFYVALR